MIKTILIEDEIHARASLKKILKIVAPNIDVICESGHVKESISLIKKEKPQLVFMDIELEDGSSFEILEQLENIDFKIIFTTAYSQYAINAFKFSATDYLLKPIDPSELQNAIEKSIIDLEKDKYHQEMISVLQNNLTKEEQKIVLKTTEQRYVLYLKDIIRLEADTAYTIFYTSNQKIIISKNLKYYQDLLGERFIRCHQSHLVNTKHIKGIYKNKSLRLFTDELIPIASRKLKEINLQIGNL